jgi:hypothetical protein
MRPKNITRFEWFAYGGLLFGFLSIPLLPERVAQITRHGILTAVEGMIFAIALVTLPIILAARRRQNWARWLFAIMIVFGLPTYVLGIPQTWKVSSAATFFQGLATALNLLALWCAFTGDANGWFKRDSVPTSPSEDSI